MFTLKFVAKLLKSCQLHYLSRALPLDLGAKLPDPQTGSRFALVRLAPKQHVWIRSCFMATYTQYECYKDA